MGSGRRFSTGCSISIVLALASCVAPPRDSNLNYPPDPLTALFHPFQEQPRFCQLGSGTETRFVTLLPSECAAENARLKAEAQAKQAEEQREAQETLAAVQAQQEAAQKEAEAERELRATAEAKRGYKQVSFEIFQLDGKDFAKVRQKVAIDGGYVRIGQIDFIMPTPVATMMAQKGRGTDQGIIILSDRAPRSVRARLIGCRGDYVTAQVGCPLHILGHAAMCDHVTFARDLSEPCIDIEPSDGEAAADK